VRDSYYRPPGPVPRFHTLLPMIFIFVCFFTESRLSFRSEQPFWYAVSLPSPLFWLSLFSIEGICQFPTLRNCSSPNLFLCNQPPFLCPSVPTLGVPVAPDPRDHAFVSGFLAVTLCRCIYTPQSLRPVQASPPFAPCVRLSLCFPLLPPNDMALFYLVLVPHFFVPL